jgi:putative ABC transport system ATP-binding protein
VDAHGQTTVMVTHDARAATTADRVVFLADGRIVEDLYAPTEEQILDVMTAPLAQEVAR